MQDEIACYFRTPRLNGKVERSDRIDSDEVYKLLDGVVLDDTGLFNEKLRVLSRPHRRLPRTLTDLSAARLPEATDRELGTFRPDRATGAGVGTAGRRSGKDHR